jgi:hypothetical protein
MNDVSFRPECVLLSDVEVEEIMSATNKVSNSTHEHLEKDQIPIKIHSCEQARSEVTPTVAKPSFFFLNKT